VGPRPASCGPPASAPEEEPEDPPEEAPDDEPEEEPEDPEDEPDDAPLDPSTADPASGAFASLPDELLQAATIAAPARSH